MTAGKSQLDAFRMHFGERKSFGCAATGCESQKYDQHLQRRGVPVPKIVRFHEFGGPEKLEIEEIFSREPGEGEIKLRVQAVGLNRAEALYMRGSYYGDRPTLPSRIGFEAAGTVEAVGPGVEQSFVGKQVSTMGGFSQSRHGVLGEEAVVPFSAAAEYPTNLSPAQGASIWLAYLTAWGALVHHAHVSSGDFVVIPAASSSVGLAAIQIARDAGAVAIAATRTADKREELLGLGADHVIVTDDEDLPERVRDVTRGNGARIVFDAVGGPYVEKLADAAALGATIFLYGGLSGRATVYPLAAGLAKGISLRGYTMNEVRSRPAVLHDGQSYVRERLLDGRFTPRIARTFPLVQSAEAYRFLESNAQIGKVVITI